MGSICDTRCVDGAEAILEYDFEKVRVLMEDELCGN